MRLLSRHFAGLLFLAVTTVARAEEGGVSPYASGSFASFMDVLSGDPSVGAQRNELGYANYEFVPVTKPASPDRDRTGEVNRENGNETDDATSKQQIP